jgi:cytidyltransferase-like protein
MTRIYADIAGDLLHYGHIEFFKNLRKHGDYVIIGIHSDHDIFLYKNKYPILNVYEREKMLNGCKYIDEVWINTPVFLTEKYLTDNNIDIVAHAHDEDDHIYDEYYSVPIRLNKFVRLDYSKGISSSEIIQRCINRKKDIDL